MMNHGNEDMSRRRMPCLPYCTETTSLDRVYNARAPLADTIGEMLSPKSSGLLAHGENIWIGKVACSLSNVSPAYCLVAVKAAGTHTSQYSGGHIARLFGTPLEEVKSHQILLSKIPKLAGYSIWKLELLILQALQFIPRLRQCPDILKMVDSEQGKWLRYIPFT